MNKLFKVLFLNIIIAMLFSCSKENTTSETTYPRLYNLQTPGEITEIENFFNEYHMNVDSNKDVEFIKKEGANAGLTSIKDEFNPQFKMINYNGYDFKVYYIQHQQGLYPEKRPCPKDSTFVVYHGMLLKKKSGYDTNKSFNTNQTFDKTDNPIWLTLSNVIPGWTKMIPFLFPGNHSTNPSTGVVNFSDFGSSVIFLPSGLGYYSTAQTKIPSYSTLIFNIKLMKVNFSDTDFDQIETRDEEYELDLTNQDNPWKNLKRDTDGDSKLDYLDIDDDNDGYWTKIEMRNPAGGFFTYQTVPACTDGKKRVYSKLCHN